MRPTGVQKKNYTKPTLTEVGSIEQVTQAFGGLGSGDLIFSFTDGEYGKEGCYLNNSPFCVYS